MEGLQVIENETKELDATNYKEVAIDYLKSMGLNLPQKHASQFIELCRLNGLNPFKREIYAVGYGDNYNIITGYEVYLKRAERLGKLNGWKFEIRKEQNDTIGVITINRKDWEYPFVHEVYLSECIQKTKEGKPNSVWGKMPNFMLKKVAIAQGFRMCFPDEFGGMPYTSDELNVEESKEKNITPTEWATAEETHKINELVSATYKDGAKIFVPEDMEKLSEMKKTKTAKEVIEYLEANVKQRRELKEAL